MARIHYHVGDATSPIEGKPGPKLITHVCNDLGGWGAGFVLALSEKWPTPEKFYRAWHRAWQNKTGMPFLLGESQFVPVGTGIWVVNMIAQHGFMSADNPMPLRTLSLARCLRIAGMTALDLDGTIHMPRIGCGLAGGDWERDVAPVIQKAIVDHGVDVHVYDLR